jgi:signal transduction histidine kinase
LSNPFFIVAVFVWLAITVFMLYAQIYRYRRVSTPEQRQQTRWFVFGLIAWFVVMAVSSVPYMIVENLPPGSPFPWWALAGSLLWGVGLAIVPVSLTVAVTRYRLYDIDVIINRTLVYGALTASVVAIYALVVGGVGVVFQSSGNLLVSLLATGLVAVFFQPLRERLQQAVNRMMFGERDDPYQVLRQLGQRLESSGAPAAVLPAIVETVAQALKLPHAEITLRRGDDFEPAAQYGRANGEPVGFPIQYQSETIGYLRVSPRFSKEDLTEADEELLRQIARQTGPAARAVQLTKDLQSSRVHLVTAREEERRRLRRDLHDGLGPVLASQGLKMAAASQLMRDDPEKAQQILEELAAQNESTVSEIRRLVYDLRPAALDDLGLVGAVRDYAAALSDHRSGAKGVRIDVRQPDRGLPPLSAAVEAAAYRIAVEALTNVTRHAQAKRCVISFDLERGNFGDFLRLEVADDGVGMSDERRAGVGLTSMRERAEELGGTFQVQSKPGEGTHIILRLPLPEED